MILEKIFLITTLFLSSPVFAQSSSSDWLTVQGYYQAQTEKVLKIFDNEAMVIVQVVARPPSENLPGTSLTLSHPGTISEDIDRVNVFVFTNQESLDKSVAETISQAINLDARKLKIILKKPKLEAKASVKTAYMGIKEMQAAVEAGFGRLIMILMIGMAGLGLGIVMTGLLDFISKKKVFAFLVDGIKSAAEQFGVGAGSGVAMPIRRQELDFDDSKSSSGSPRSGLSGGSLLPQRIRLPDESLTEFFADCYWTQNEAWAHRAWISLTTQQKKQLLASLDYLEEYVAHFSQIEPAEMQEVSPWDDIRYLNPGSLNYVSQDDLWKVVQSDRQLWWSLSEMRQSAFNLTLKDRTDLLKVKRVKKTMPTFLKSAIREFKAQLQMRTLTIDDEIYLMGELTTIAAEYRKDLPSLLWLKLLPEVEAQKLIESLDAKTISQALVGPKEFLTWVTQLIPEKKMNLVLSYQKKFPADRSSYSYLFVFQQVLKQIDIMEQAKKYGPKNAPTNKTNPKNAA